MYRMIKREGLIYVLIWCFNQILLGSVNPFGLALALAAISCGYNKIIVVVMTIMGNLIIFPENIKEKIIALSIVAFFNYVIARYKKCMNYITNIIMFLGIYIAIRMYYDYEKLSFLYGIIFLFELLIVFCSTIVFYIAISCLFKYTTTSDMSLPQKIGLATIITLIGVYIIQVRNEHVSLMKCVVLYVLSFLGMVIYNMLLDLRNDKKYVCGQVYNNMVYNKLADYSVVIKQMSKSICGEYENDVSRMYENNRVLNNRFYKEQEDRLFDKIADTFCSMCDRRSYCWEKEFETTSEATSLVLAIGMSNGIVCLKDIPEKFRIRCKKINEIINIININLEIIRNNMWWQKKVEEMKHIMSLQLEDLSKGVKQFSKSMYFDVSLKRKEDRMIRKALKGIGVQVRDLYCYTHNGVKELIITVKTYGQKVKTNDIAREISAILGSDYKLGEYAPRLINNKIVEINMYMSEEFKVMSSCMCIKKDGEKYCGDNYSIVEDDIAETVLILSDGMGSGKNAYIESKRTVEMLEELIRAGFSKEVAISLTNSTLYLNGEENRYATLDVCTINRYTGMCDFTKVGASYTFLKRNDFVYEIESDTLPLGVLGSAECFSESIEIRDQDVIIMITDGFIDCMNVFNKNKDDLIYIIKNIECNNPNLFIEEMVYRTVGEQKIVDDASVLVACIWKVISEYN